MMNEEAIKDLNTMFLAASEPEQYISIGSFEEVKGTIKKAIKALETVQRIDDVLNVEGMTEIDVLDEIMEAVSEFKYDCGVSE